MNRRQPDLKFLARNIALFDQSSNRSITRLIFEERKTARYKAGVKDHVSVEKVEKLATCRLKRQLGTGAARAVRGIGKLQDPDRIAARNFYRSIGGPTIGEHDLPIEAGNGCQRAFN